MKYLIIVVSFLGFHAFAQNDPFAGKIATCVSDGPTKNETWRFVGLTKEYTKQFKVANIAMEQKGKYDFSKNVLSISEYKQGTQEIDAKRKFKLQAMVSDSGFEYMWVAPNGNKTPYTCTWSK